MVASNWRVICPSSSDSSDARMWKERTLRSEVAGSIPAWGALIQLLRNRVRTLVIVNLKHVKIPVAGHPGQVEHL